MIGGSICGGGVMREGEMATEAGGTHLTLFLPLT